MLAIDTQTLHYTLPVARRVNQTPAYRCPPSLSVSLHLACTSTCQSDISLQVPSLSLSLHLACTSTCQSDTSLQVPSLSLSLHLACTSTCQSYTSLQVPSLSLSHCTLPVPRPVNQTPAYRCPVCLSVTSLYSRLIQFGYTVSHKNVPLLLWL